MSSRDRTTALPCALRDRRWDLVPELIKTTTDVNDELDPPLLVDMVTMDKTLN